jgi:outer membrane receptor protein involved in Fe transport
MPIGKPLGNGPLLRVLALVALLSAAPSAAEERVLVAQAEGAEAQTEPKQPSQPAPQGPPGSGVEEIVVKGADSAAATDFNVADSVTAFSAADLVALGAANIADLAAFTPNLEIVTAGATTPTLFIRGVGLNDFGANASSSVAVYQDDVPMNAQAIQLGTLFDMETVNVLRGPQGTGLARNSSAGAIKLYGRKPTGQYTGYLRGQGGNFNYQEYEGAIEAPIFQDMLSGRLAFVFTDRDGTMQNRCAGKPPRELRVAVPGTATLTALHKTENDAPWSMCGEGVSGDSAETGTVFFGKSKVPPGLPKWMNDRHNWATRGTLLFEPTLETSFVLNGHLSRRNEFSRVGQSYGTNGFFCLNGNIADCNTGAEEGGSKIFNVLGGKQGIVRGYQAPEVIQDLTFLAPCFQFGFGFRRPGQGGCTGNNANPNFALFDTAQQVVARELARNLDDEPWKGDFNRAGKTTNDVYGGSLKGEYLLPWDLELDTVTAFDRYYRKIDVDLDFSPETLFQIVTQDDGYQFYQDVKLAGETPLAETPIRWDLGGWVLPEKIDVKADVDLGDLGAFGVGHREYTQRLLSFGGYGSFSFDFADDFTLDGGARWNWERKRMDYKLITGLNIPRFDQFQDIWSAPTGTIRLTYRFREDAHAFLKYTRGWKPGHYNATGSVFSGVTKAEPESIDAYETGLAAQWFGGVLGGEASLFYYNYKDYQIFIAQQFAQSNPEFVVINANDAEVYGAEVNAILRPWAGGYVNVNFGWLETQFLDFLILQQTTVITDIGFQVVNRELQNSGNPLLNSPRFKVAITAEQAFPIGHYGYIIPRYDGAWSDDTYYDAAKGRGQPNLEGFKYAPKLAFAQRAHWVHGARLAYRTPDGRLEIAGWVRNLENSAYKTYSFDASNFTATSIHFVGDPRTYGATLQVTF